ncbi:MAG: hypothetical protein R3185_02215 [Candidatus Thermoplasmatota archaeon]|nr:hypothetical protein [Candidatus Thermoplasmatota archaeon]
MGRTLGTFRVLLDRLEMEWADVRRALTGKDRERWDDLWQQARRHASAAGNAAPLNPMEAALLAMLLEHEKRLAHLEAEAPPSTGEEEPP